MFTFFKISVCTAVAALFILSLITISDVFIHSNQLQFYVLTIISAIIFFAIGFTGIVVYKNFKNIYQHILKEDEQNIFYEQKQALKNIFKNLDITKIAFVGGIADYINLRSYYDMPINDIDII